MPKTNFTKIKLLKLWEILSQDSDEDHPLSTSEIIEKLKSQGVECDRKTLYEDIRTLNEYGYEMPILGLGTYSLHGDTVKNSVRAALESGVRLIDTAYMYGNEREIGEAIRASDVPREEI